MNLAHIQTVSVGIFVLVIRVQKSPFNNDAEPIAIRFTPWSPFNPHLPLFVCVCFLPIRKCLLLTICLNWHRVSFIVHFNVYRSIVYLLQFETPFFHLTDMRNRFYGPRLIARTEKNRTIT